MRRSIELLASLALVALLSVGADAAHAQCNPQFQCCSNTPAGGTPRCGQASPTVQPQRVDQGAGNPLDIITGNKYEEEADLPALPGMLGIELVRHYNSVHANDEAGAFGRGWRLSYHARLIVRDQGVRIVQGDGASLDFARGIADPDRYGNVDGMRGAIVRVGAGPGVHYEWRWPQGRVLHFDVQGRLTQIVEPTGEFASLQYDPRGRLLQVSDPQGRSLKFEYLGERIAAIDTPVGRYRYTFEGDRLVTATLPGNIQRHYQYGDARHPHHLTAITVDGAGSDGRSMQQRLARWTYDDQGRAVSSVKGDGADNIERVTLERRFTSDGGSANLTNSLGQRTRYFWKRIGKQQRLVEAVGPGCASCGDTDVRYSYDRQGRLTEMTRLDAGGRPVQADRHVLDGWGRIVRTSRVVHGAGRPPAERWLVRYEYDAGDRIVLMARPSVVSGREHVVRIAYNEAGQPTSATEEGYGPLDDRGQPAIDGRPIARTTTYTYSRINGRSVLTGIDGPLPNGPKGTPEDSDITRIDWDVRGSQATLLTQPMNLVSRIVYDDAGRIREVTGPGGSTDVYEHRPGGQVAAILRRHGALGTGTAWRYDALGRRTETLAIAGGTHRPQQAQGFDAAGRLQWQADAIGVLLQQRHDSESRLVESGHYGNGIAKIHRYEHDLPGRLARIAEHGGAALSVLYDDRGRPRALVDALGRKRARADEIGAPTVRTLHDDFGRAVAIVSPDSGTTVREFDAADRLVSSTDAQGNRARYEHDVAGRIGRQRIVDKANGTATLTTWRYEGTRLVALEHPTQHERYEHNRHGWLTARVVRPLLPDGSGRTSVTRYGYDDNGVLQSTSLPDGSILRYTRNGQGQVVAIERSRVRTEWLRWLLPTRTMASDIERDLVGPRRYLAGNGVEARYERSREGVLARVVHSPLRKPLPAAAQAARIAELLGVNSGHAAPPAAPASATSASAPGALGLPQDPQALIDHRYLWDVRGNLLHIQSRAGLPGQADYAYDGRDRLIVAVRRRDEAAIARYLYDGAGRRVLSQQGITEQHDLLTNTRKAHYESGTHRWLGDSAQAVRYDAGGMPLQAGERAYAWDAVGRLVEVRQNGRSLVRYTYNHRGERIGKTAGELRTAYLYEHRRLTGELDAKGRITRQYIHMAEQPIAVIDTPRGRALAREASGAWARIADDIATVVQAWFGDDERIVWLHANHLGAVEAATDDARKVVWRASYQPFGAATVTSANFTLNLRLPGQYADAETQLHYNDHRYYDPQRGEYLSPDPLGTVDGPNPYAYVRSNPLRYVDPRGLVLFAFDGTGNMDDAEWLRQNDSSPSNVLTFRRLYDDGNARYVTGVGTLHRDAQYGDIEPPAFDMGFNLTGLARIDRMIQYFNDEAELATDDDVAMDIDIVGFSRGAAQARDFANLIAASTRGGLYRYMVTDANGVAQQRCQRVNFRFMGLWDTVLSTNAGRHYNLAIPEAFAHVAHAVALNEHRGRSTRSLPGSRLGAFPLESILQSAHSPSPPPGRVRIERGFIGSHADIGGGFGPEESQLSQVALTWMVQQANAAGVSMNSPPDTIIANPVLHDKSDNQYSVIGRPQPDGEERQVRYRNGTTTTQRRMVLQEGMTHADTQQGGLITYLPPGTNGEGMREREPRADFVTGTVDMRSYLEWLNDHGYDIPLTVQ